MERSDSRPSLPSHFVAFAGRLPPRAPVFVAPHKPDAGLGPGVFGSGHPQGLSLSRRRRSGVPSSWGTPIARLPCSVDAGRTAGTRPLRCRGVAPGMCKAEAPAKGLSALNSTAFGLAVYASPGGSPRPDARLASSRWSDATGRASHPQGSYERFPRCSRYIPSSFPKLAWRKHIDLGTGGLAGLSCKWVPPPRQGLA